jgi:hypothetical protein
MMRTHIDETLYFSTTVELKMNGVIYRPAICYKVPPCARAALEPLAAQGKVIFHKTMVHFANGAISHVPSVQPASGVDSIVEETKVIKRKVE